MKHKPGIVFMGTPAFAAYQLQKIIESGWNVKAVVTIPDKPMGRGQVLSQSEVKKTALQYGLPVLQPEKLRDEKFIHELKSLEAGVFVVVAFRMLPEAVWSMPPLGTINLHASLLPQYRGAAPINWVVINGEKKTGVTTFFINEKIDEGNWIDKNEVMLDENETAGTLHDKLMYAGADLLLVTLKKIADGAAVAHSQQLNTGEVLKTAPKISKETCHINWNQPAEAVVRQIRGLSPYPGAWTKIMPAEGSEFILKILSAQSSAKNHNEIPGTIVTDYKTHLHIFTQRGYIDVLWLQPQGKKAMAPADWLRGVREKFISAG